MKLFTILIVTVLLIKGTFNAEVTTSEPSPTPTPIPSPSPTPTPIPTPAPTPPAPVSGDIDLTGYTLVFEENFDSVSVATTDVKGDKTWFFWPPYGPAGSFSFSHWSADSTTLKADNGVLVNTAWWDAGINDAGGRNWRSGCLSSMDKTRAGFGQRYGYFSARIKMPNAGRGAFPAFWLASSSGIPNAGSKGYEIDVMEWWGHNQGQVAHTTHPWNTDGSQAGPPWEQGGFVNVFDPINTWHVYGCKVAPDYISFYIDGVETRRTPTNNDYLRDPLYIIVDYALGGGYPIDGEPFASHGPSALLVDWVRAYALPSDVVIPPVPGVSVENPGFEADGASVQEVRGWTKRP
jgi:beta-glucanase (GH16 family)